MEYIKGVPLSRAHLFGREEPLDDVELFQLRVDQFAQICDAIQFAHQRGIIHRDLKPGNILVDRNGVPKVFDFGVAKVMGVLDKAEATLTGEFVGTFAYASPEQVKGDPSEVDTRSDVYALGLILYELLTEQHPYPVRGAVSEVIQNITSTEAEPPSRYDTRIGRDLEAIVLKAIEEEPSDRYQSAAARWPMISAAGWSASRLKHSGTIHRISFEGGFENTAFRSCWAQPVLRYC